MRKFKLIVFILLLISFILTLLCGIFGTSISLLSSKEIKKGRELNKNLINEFKINNVDTVYDKNNNIYYYTLPESYEKKSYILKLEIEGNYKYKIIGETLNVVKIDYSKAIDIIIYNDKYYYETKIQITNLPLVSINVEDEITKDEINSNFKYININSVEKVMESNNKINIRGGTSTLFEKKSYKIEFYNEKYTKDKKIQISNLYYGDSLILDAVYRDPSKVRNLLSTELWNDISDNFTNIDIYSEFVELFINNEYKGLYILTEPINRSKLNLNKSTNNDTSILIKSQGWSFVTSDMDFLNISDDKYMEYELKYPNDKKLYEISWGKILSKLSNYYDLNFSSNYEKIKSTWNMENYIDIILFNAFINNVDNMMSKNNYFYMISLNIDEVYIQPWDMEYSFGLIYDYRDEKLIKKVEDYDKILTNFEHENSKEINKLLIKRYKELRKDILTKEYFDNKLNKYLNELTKGSVKRDSNLWYEYDVEKEIEDIRIWIYNRLDYMDEYIEGLENE